MKAPKIFSLFFAFALMLSGCQKDVINPDILLAPESSTGVTLNANAVNYIVITNSETLPSGFEKKLSQYGTIVRSVPEIGMIVVKPVINNFEAKVTSLAEVKAVVPDFTAKLVQPVNVINESSMQGTGITDPLFPLQWGLDAINAPEAWNAGFTGKKSRVFILDSGIDAEHKDLVSNLNKTLCTSFVPGEDFNIDKGEYFNHGTHVAGIIAAARNGKGVVGVAPEAEIVAVKVLSEYTGSGAFSWINAGIVYAANNGADVINMSLGATFDRNGFYLDENGVMQKIPAVYIQYLIIAQQRAINYAFRKGAVIVTSAGNDGMNADGNSSIIIVPADLQNVIAVSATAPDYWYNDFINHTADVNFDIPASYTDFGKSLIAVAAPGGDFDFYNLPYWYYDMVLSTISKGYGWAAGTSMAAPHVSGVAALIIGKNGGNMDPQEVTRKLMETSDNIDGNGVSLFYGKGRINAFRAVTE